MVHSRTVHLPLCALLIRCTLCGRTGTSPLPLPHLPHRYLREFLFQHGFPHAAIRQLHGAWVAGRRNTGTFYDTCVRMRVLRGCQAKMVLGVPCAAPFELNASLLAEATRRV